MNAEFNENDILGLGENYEPDIDIDDVEGSRQTLYRVVFDKSGSMGNYEDQVRESFVYMKDLFSRVKEADEILVAVTQFDNVVVSGGYQRAETLSTDYTTGSTTALYDAIVDAQYRLVNDKGTGYMQQLVDNGTTVQSAILIFTDGYDNASKKKPKEAADALRYLKTNEVPVVFVAFGSEAVNEAKTLGIAANNIIEIDTDHVDTNTLGAKLKDILQIASKSVVSMSQSVGGAGNTGIFNV